MKNITYLLGAGASYNSIPVMNGLNSAIMNYINRLSGLFVSENILHTHILKIWLPLIINACNHPSIDTYAKKLFLTDDKYSLRQLKLILSSYFLHEQSEESISDNYYGHTPTIRYSNLPIDPRYDFFMAALLKQSKANPVLPDNLNIVSWNYDSQLEMAYHLYSKISHDDDESLRRNLKMYPLIENEYSKYDDGDKDYRIVKLNGTASSIFREKVNSFELHSYRKFFFKEAIDQIKSIIGTAIDSPKVDEYVDYGSNINFAWELQKNWFSKQTVETAKEIISKSSTLVIIGYSFPVFNRDIDKYIFEDNKLEKIYIQDLTENIEGVRSRASKIMDIEYEFFELETSVDQFLIPFEL